ncbi:MAG: 1-(5-phosphoribosyl)-5-[(5-phosphoribosylamino)methylideneamino]imidazole-4-carboxamide isomerase [Oscillospiraceae bacterium]|jgi:phosphoribosylformimino-5-aminoimidazole carboxamide ribotide isomerase|nr:1-(5-phosphoribosyl)-5-[(5-phosphoribosylamino)methylideneamino]imidazole-4-carboxamide isomerase [Oscillospiraceae bacterium]
MTILPAIDIKDGKPVRLRQGDFDTVEQVADNALATAFWFAEQGARWVHMVDLDGAKTGKRVNAEIFIEVAQKSGLLVELGGGIRSMEDIDFYLSSGIARVVLGSAALRDPALVKAAVEKYAERIAVGIDAKGGKATAEGWIAGSDVHFLDLARQMVALGVSTIIFTDIATDGMLQGPNIGQLLQLRDSVDCTLVASGGIADIDDVLMLKAARMDAAICGKSVYAGTLNLMQAVTVCENS